MRLSFPVGGWQAYPKNNIHSIKARINEKLKDLIGYLPVFKVESIGISASGMVWVKVSTETYRLDHQGELAS